MPVQKAVLRHNGFTFKQFFVAHDRCAMKVGTDGILLGAWAPIAQVTTILDIGSGSGLLALMLAQRTADKVMIDAVELDKEAAGQARENCDASPWARRIAIYQADIVEWSRQATQRYSLIVSNPPYFDQGVDCASPERNQARYTTTLDHQQLLRCAAQLISEEGFLSVVLPTEVGDRFIHQAKAMGWHLRFRTDIAETEMRPPHRVLLTLSPMAGELFSERLVIRGPDNRYSEAFSSLTRDFYLFM